MQQPCLPLPMALLGCTGALALACILTVISLTRQDRAPDMGLSSMSPVARIRMRLRRVWSRSHLAAQGAGCEASSSGADGQHGRHGAVEAGGVGLHGSNLLLGGEAALDARAHLCIRLAALVADGLLKCAPLPFLAIPEPAEVATSYSVHNRLRLSWTLEGPG